MTAATGTARGTAGRTRWRRRTTCGTRARRDRRLRARRRGAARGAARAAAPRHATGRRGLDELRRSVRERLRQARTAGRLDGTLQEVRELLDQALAAERRRAVPRPGRRRAARRGRARRAAATTPPARSASCKDYQWRSPEARQAYERDPGPAAPRGARQLVRVDEAGAARTPTPEDMQAVKDMIADLQRHARRRRPRRGHPAAVRRVHGQARRVLPGRTRSRSRSWSTRWPAGPPPQERMMDGLSPEQRQELADLMAQAMARHGAGQRDGAAAGRAARGPPRPALGRPRADADGEQAARHGRRDQRRSQELADLEELSSQLSPGLRRAPRWPTSTRSCWSGRWAARPSTTSRRCAGWSASCERQGYLNRSGGKLELTARPTTVELATSPAAWPPMPSAITSRCGPAYPESSLLLYRPSPTSERAA